MRKATRSSYAGDLAGRRRTRGSHTLDHDFITKHPEIAASDARQGESKSVYWSPITRYSSLTKHKCDEKKPVCGGCRRHSVACEYRDSSTCAPSRSRARIDDDECFPAASATEPTSNSGPGIVISCPIDCNTNNDLEIPESAVHRRLELRLLHHYPINTSATFPASHNSKVRAAWTVDIPKLANSQPSLLYALLSVSALHLSKSESQDLDLRAAHRRYLDLALRAHRKAVASFKVKSVDAVCFTSVLIVLDAFAALQDRVLGQPYEPPMQWLCMSNGAWNVFHLAWQFDDSTAAVTAIIRSAFVLSDYDSLFSERNREEFPELLTPLAGGLSEQDRGDNGDLDDRETREAYETTLSYIGSIKRAVNAREHSLGICRWFLAFPVVVPGKMIELLEEKKPRALVVLAHYFALAGPMAVDRSNSKERG